MYQAFFHKIQASGADLLLVRQYIKENNWVGVKKLAPPSTYDFLQERAYIAPSA